jgi:hypothetical protein
MSSFYDEGKSTSDDNVMPHWQHTSAQSEGKWYLDRSGEWCLQQELHVCLWQTVWCMISIHSLWLMKQSAFQSLSPHAMTAMHIHTDQQQSNQMLSVFNKNEARFCCNHEAARWHMHGCMPAVLCLQGDQLRKHSRWPGTKTLKLMMLQVACTYVCIDTQASGWDCADIWACE